MSPGQTFLCNIAAIILRRGIVASSLLAAILCVFPVQAIVYRHDTGYSGFVARDSDYPAVFPLYTQKNGFKICAATLINRWWAITAAHCAEQTPLASSLHSGERFEVTIAGQVFQVDRLVLHPSWPGNPGARFDASQVDLALEPSSDICMVLSPVRLRMLMTCDTGHDQACFNAPAMSC